MLLARRSIKCGIIQTQDHVPAPSLPRHVTFSLRQFLKEFLRLLGWGWTGYLLKMEILGHHAVGCCWWIGEPGSLVGSLL